MTTLYIISTYNADGVEVVRIYVDEPTRDAIGRWQGTLIDELSAAQWIQFTGKQPGFDEPEEFQIGV